MPKINIAVTHEQNGGALRIVINGKTITGNPLKDSYYPIASRIGMEVLKMLDLTTPRDTQ